MMNAQANGNRNRTAKDYKDKREQVKEQYVE